MKETGKIVIFECIDWGGIDRISEGGKSSDRDSLNSSHLTECYVSYRSSNMVHIIFLKRIIVYFICYIHMYLEMEIDVLSTCNKYM